MKFFISLLAVVLSACATATPQRQAVTASVNGPLPAPGTVMITADELKQTGRPDLSDALRMVSPIFH